MPANSSSSPPGNPPPQQPGATAEPPANQNPAAGDEASQQDNNAGVVPNLMNLVQQKMKLMDIALAQQRGFYTGLCMGQAIALFVALGYLVIRRVDY